MAYTTDQSLLLAIRQGDEVSWQSFYDTYRPLILYCSRNRLYPDEREDLVQLVMLKLFNSGNYFNYDPARGKFRDYLGRIIHNAIVDIWRKRPMETTVYIIPEEDFNSFEVQWLRDWQDYLFTRATDLLKEQVPEISWQIFDFCVMQNVPVKEVAGLLNIPAGKVYKVREKCSTILQEIIRELSAADENTTIAP